jgi:hypothetical protein
MSLLGMVGFAEGVIGDALELMLIGVFLLAVCAAEAIRSRSEVAGIAALLMVALTAFLFEPWTAFALEPSDDWDARSLQAAYLRLARWWVLASVAALAGAVRAFWRTRLPVQSAGADSYASSA